MCLTHRKKRKKAVIIAILLVLFVLLLLLLLKSCHNTENAPSEQTTPTQKTLDFEPYHDKRINIPGFSGIHLESGQLNQKVSFYNPSDNNCYFVISLYLSDDTCIYQSDYIEPGEQLTDITLSQSLEKGLYKNCRLCYRCFSLDNKTELNGSTQTIVINTR